MNRIIADAISFGRQYTRGGLALFFAFAFPILLILIFGAIFSGGNSMVITLPVQNLDDGPHSEALLSILENTTVVKFDLIPDDADIETYVNDNSLTIALYIPPDFTERITELQDAGTPGLVNVTLWGDPSRSTYSVISSAVYLSIVNLNYQLASATELVSLESRNLGSEGFTFMDYFLPGIVGLVVMTNTLYTMTSTCAEYKTRGYFKLLATTAIRKHEWLTSKFLFYTLLLFLSMIVTFLVGAAAFDMSSTLTPMSFVLIAAGTFLFLSMGMLLGSIVKDSESAVAAANAIGFPMMFLSGVFFELEAMPDYIQAIARVFPLTYLNEGLRDTMVYGNEASALVNLAVLLVIGVVFFVLASRLMSWKER